MYLSTISRSTTSAGVPRRPRLRLFGCRRARASYTAATICGSSSTRSAWRIQASCQSPISAAISPSPKLRCARRRSITRRAPPLAGILGTQQRMVELADRFDRLLQLVVVAQPAADLVYLSAAQAELAGAAAGIADRQNPHRVSATAGADRTAAVMAHDPLDQRAAHDLPGYRQFGNQRLAR